MLFTIFLPVGWRDGNGPSSFYFYFSSFYNWFQNKSKDLRSGGGEIAMEILGLIVREHRTPEGRISKKKNFLTFSNYLALHFVPFVNHLWNQLKTLPYNYRLLYYYIGRALSFINSVFLSKAHTQILLLSFLTSHPLPFLPH